MIRLRTMNLEKINLIEHYGLVQSLSLDRNVKQYISSDFLKWLERYHSTSSEKVEPGKAYVICLDNRYIGVVGSLDISDEGTLEVWYAIKKNLRGRGYGNQILEEITPHLFEHVKGLNDIELRIDKSNVASRKMAERNGYVLKEEDFELNVDVYSSYRRK